MKNLGHKRRAQRMAAQTTGATGRHVLTIKRKGIARVPRERMAQTLPLTGPQTKVLERLSGSTQSAAEIACALGRSKSGVTASLYCLQDRGLVERVPEKGWRLP